MRHMIYKNVSLSCLLPMKTYFDATLTTKLTVPARLLNSPVTGEKSTLIQAVKQAVAID